MTSLSASLPARFGNEYLPVSFLVHVGKRRLSVCRDFRSRYYSVNPVLDISVGAGPGHMEALLFRKWLVIFSKA